MGESGGSGPSGIIAILFDMDGVLIDSEPVHEAATAEAAAEFGLPPVTPDVFSRYFFGRTDFSGFRDYLTATGREDVSIIDVMARKTAIYAQRFASEVRAHQDGLATLRAAAGKGYRVAIVSGARNSEIELVVEQFGLRPILAATVGGDDVPNGKPDPAPYLTGAERLGVPPARCLVIEDAPAGITSARAAGMRCLAVDRIDRPELIAHADRVVRRVTLEAVEELAAAEQA